MAPKKEVLAGMSAYQVKAVGRLVEDPTDPERFGAHADAIMDALLLLDVRDPAIGGAATSGDIEIAVELDATSVEDAVRRGTAAIRAAIRAAGSRASHWDVLIQDVTGQRAGLVGA